MAEKKKPTSKKLKSSSKVTTYTLNPTSKTKTTPSKTKSNGKKPPKKNTLINRIREDWHQPLPTWIEGKNGKPGRLREPAYDKYPYGSLTGRKKK